MKLTTKCPQNPHNLRSYMQNHRIKHSGVQQIWTQWELDEYAKCEASCEYFVENYVKIIHLDHGLVDFVPYEYQSRMFKHFKDNRFSIMLACRQSGKSTGVIGYLLHFALFNNSEHVLIAANKLDTAKEMMRRIQRALENLPFFLQPGCKALNKTLIEFDTDTIIEAVATSSDGARGKTASLIFCDEFAFVQDDEEFYESNYPIISSTKTGKIIIVSTPNGINNQFYKLYDDAISKRNTFAPFRVDWWDVTDRDEAWKEMTIGNIGQKKFDQEFGNGFGQTSKTLISMDHLLTMSPAEPVAKHEDINIFAKPDPDHKYIMTVDVSKGRGQDYSTFSVFDISVEPFMQVATYRNNTVSPLIFPNLIYKTAMAYNEAHIIVEANMGEVVYKILYYDMSYPYMFSSRVANGRSMGLEMTQKVKRIGCSNMKDMIEQRKLTLVDQQTIEELRVFEAKNGSFAARKGCHDDMVMCIVMLSWFTDTNMFGDMHTGKLRDMLGAEQAELTGHTVPLLGYLDEEMYEDIMDVWDPKQHENLQWRVEAVFDDWDIHAARETKDGDDYMF